MADPNRRIYTSSYDPALLERRAETPYDEDMIALRDALVRHYGVGHRVLDLCCGTGSYTVTAADVASCVIGIDFSRTMLCTFAERPDADGIPLVEGDAHAIPLADASVDMVASFSSLYYMPDLRAVLAEIGRILRPGGVAIVELGNTWSLNTVVTRTQHRHAGWAKPHHVSVRAMRAYVDAAQLDVEAWRAFQLLPMYGAPRRLAWLLPLLSARWKRVLGARVSGRLLDEWVSSLPVVRQLAFRHLVVARRR